MELVIGLVVLITIGLVFFMKSRQAKLWTESPATAEFLYYKRGGSRGMKVTEVSIDTDGKVVLKVAKKTERNFTLNNAQREEIVILANAAFAEKLESTYLTGARDLPKLTLRYKGTSVVFHKRNAPLALVKLAQRVKEMTTLE